MADSSTTVPSQPTEIKEGDQVQWNYGGGHPSGTVAEVKTDQGGKLEIETAKGNTIHKNSDPSNPAVRIGTAEGKSDVVKRASELTKTGEFEGDGEGAGTKEVAVGEKCEREGEAVSDTGPRGDSIELKDQEAAEKDAGKETKKAKLDESADAGTTGASKDKEEVGEGKGAGNTLEAAAPPKKGGKRGRGRGGGKAARAAAPAQRTRTSSRVTKKSAEAAEASEDAGKNSQEVSNNAPVHGEAQKMELDKGSDVPAQDGPAPGENTPSQT